MDLDSLEISKDRDVSKDLRAPDQADPTVPERAEPTAAVEPADTAATLAAGALSRPEPLAHAERFPCPDPAATRGA
ncbi:hypothetical protein CCR82_09610 [Halochromatium salexigens]|uniref:Uncharacterized protein n=1 Tax=Halochromatium salexigens TaxID=49447 RepID=A0AAJ0UG04_HALSE|nr:hypothetical protein [Halochromatium salexigens]